MESILPTPPLPCVEIQILSSKFAHPKKVIGYMDTGAQITMMNPKILPAEEWTEHTEFFMAANGKIFKTELMTKRNIGIKFFPDCIIWTKVIGSNLPNKDIVIGMDVYSAADRLQILPRGIKFKRNFKAYT
ncbi:polyprotein-like, partial [Trifolium medium]|nr:polyprotein-like [Trifolium medium]